ncbi:hypothetical protein BD309DRAFT_972215 [Dichomitus squalens]|nr:hypothetical protein BD309DRAFT_972214 [Dichomitus squalens]TBU38295.1 hypothetical protein BD309DRAFT_972215 [Dichomitus squalens]
MVDRIVEYRLQDVFRMKERPDPGTQFWYDYADRLYSGNVWIWFDPIHSVEIARQVHATF